MNRGKRVLTHSHSLSTLHIPLTSMDVRVKVEIKREKDECDQNYFQQRVKEQPAHEDECNVHVKKEQFDDDACGVSEAAAREGLYEGHQVKDEIVVGPEVIQPRDAAYTADDAVLVPGPSAQAHRPAAGKGTFTCDICHKQLASKRNLTNHSRTHTGPVLILEPRPPSIREQRAAAAAGEPAFTCKICCKQLTTKHSLTNHLRIHTGEKPFACEICHKRFADKKHLKTHIRIHTGEKPFSCDICHQQFNHKITLINHLRIHTGEKPFSCEICHKLFSRQFSLTCHLRTHTGLKPFSCEICNKNFVNKSHLNKHKAIHTGEKPFSCEICHKRYTQKHNYTNHLRTHTGRDNSIAQ